MQINLLDYLGIRCRQNWLINEDNEDFYYYTNEVFKIVSSGEILPKVLIMEDKPQDFMASFLAAITAGCPVFLGNPHWSESELIEVLKLVQPQIICGETSIDPQDYYEIKAFHNLRNVRRPYVMIPTGGTSGKIKFAVHDLDNLVSSINAFLQYFKLKTINSWCILPVYHVSGLMQFLRSFFSGGKFVFSDYDSLKNNIYPQINPEDYFISLVPTQLQFFLENNPQWLAKFKTVLLGGAPASTLLLETARQYKINLAPTYGMTETASGIAILKPREFLKGNDSSGKVLPHSKVEIMKTGLLRISSDSLFINYYPDVWAKKTYFTTQDMGYFDEKNYLYITGRNDRKIISGGENIYPEEIEREILATGLVSDVYVIGFQDEKWGEVVTAIFVSKNENISEEEIKDKIKSKLSKYKVPKKWIQVTEIPRNKQGKINLKLLKKLANNHI